MPDIKLHQRESGTIKTLGRDVKTFHRRERIGKEIKNVVASDNTGEQAAENAPAQIVESEASVATIDMARVLYQTNKKMLPWALKQPFMAKKKVEQAKQSEGEAKKAVKEVGRTIKTEFSFIKNKSNTASLTTPPGEITHAGRAVKSTSNTVKTSQSAIKTASAAQNTQNMSATAGNGKQSLKQSLKTALQSTKRTAKTSYDAMAATVRAISAGTDAILSLLATGGWAVVIIIIIVAVIGMLSMSALGIFMANDTDGRSLASVQSELSSEFYSKLEQQKEQMTEFDKVEVRPAPTITEWPSILSVFSVRAQKQELSPAQMTTDTIALLRSTLWDMVILTPSKETVTTIIRDETGKEIVTVEEYGVINVTYRPIEEMSARYKFDTTDIEQMKEVVNIFAESGGILISNGKFVNPCPGGTFNGNDYPSYPISQKYHAGRDIAAAPGTPIYAAGDGKIINMNDQSTTYGNHIMIDHGNELYTLYAHCQTLLVSVGQTVKQGQQIATVGSTGNVTGPHLHFEVRAGGKVFGINNVDPLTYLVDDPTKKSKENKGANSWPLH